MRPRRSSRTVCRPGEGWFSIPRPRPATPGGRDLSGALEAFLDPRPRDDLVAVAETESRLQRPLLVPERVEPVAQTLELVGDPGVEAVGEPVPELGPPLARPLDLLVDLGQGHVLYQRAARAPIPGVRGKTTRARSPPRSPPPRRLRARTQASAVAELVEP